MSNQFVPTFEHLPSRDEVIAAIVANWPLDRRTEVIPVEDALDRIPAADVFSRTTLPVYRASMGDGIAVDSSRFANGTPDTSNWVPGIDYARADTGDDFDDAFDAVIMIEDVTLGPGGTLSIHDGVTVTPGACVRKAGSTIKEGDPLVKAHMPLRPKDLAWLQTGGIESIEVVAQPVVAFIPSGSELIAPGTPLSRGKVYDTNSLLVKLTLRQFGAQPLMLPIVRDEYAPLEAALDGALPQADIVVIGGGSSKGDEDITATLLHHKGHVLCHGTHAVPGKPLCAAIISGKPVINLPGPFMAAYHGLEWLLSALVAHYLGIPRRARPTVTATLKNHLEGSDRVSMLQVVDVTRKKDGGFWAQTHNFKTLPMWRTVASNAHYMTKIGDDIPAGGEIEVELLRGVEYIPADEA